MSRREERRSTTRILTEFGVVLSDHHGAEIDARAIAHDISEKGFKVETRAELAAGQVVRIRLSIGEGADVKARARVAWTERAQLWTTAGAVFLGLAWKDRRRLRRLTGPPGIDWSGLLDKAIVALSLLLIVTAAGSALAYPVWRDFAERLLPKALAAVALGLALRALLSSRH